MSSKANEMFKVQMLDTLEINYKGITLSSEKIGSNMMELLLTYVLCNRKQEISISELSEVLWAEGESDNPVGALKNLMYRLRNLLKKQFEEDSFIITGRGTYYWNKEINVEIDIEEFERLLDKDNESKAMIPNYEKAIQLYKGIFLPKFHGEYWVIQKKTYCQSLYSNCVKTLATLYNEAKEYEKIEYICNKALKFDRLDEQIHYLLIHCLIKQKKNNIAVQQYLYLKKTLYEELGVNPSNELQDLYQTLLKQQNSRELDLNIIQKDLVENDNPILAFMCDYSDFKKIYQLEARRLDRLGMSIYVCLVSIDTTLNVSVTSNFYIKLMSDFMKDLGTVIQTTLRLGDVIAKYSATQYVILLPGCSYESAQKVMNRVVMIFKGQEKHKNATVECDFKELVMPTLE